MSGLAEQESRVSPLLRDRSGVQRVTNIELFFDLVYVFAVTQLSHYLIGHSTVTGALQTGLLLAMVWLVWSYTPGGASAPGLARGTCPAQGEELRYPNPPTAGPRDRRIRNRGTRDDARTGTAEEQPPGRGDQFYRATAGAIPGWLVDLTTPGQPQRESRHPSPKRPATPVKLIAIFFD
jgi:hypothetical protein